MKSILAGLPIVGMIGCIAAWVIAFIIPFVFKPVQAAISPYACQEGWTLASESHTCTTDNGTGTCSNMICVDPQGQTAQAWKLMIFQCGTFAGMMLFILLMVLIMMQMRTRGTMAASSPYGPAATIGGVGTGMNMEIPQPTVSISGLPPIAQQFLMQNMTQAPPVHIQVQDMNIPLDEQIAKLDRLRVNGTLTEVQYQQAVEQVRRAYGDL